MAFQGGAKVKINNNFLRKIEKILTHMINFSMFWVPIKCFGWEIRKLFFCYALVTIVLEVTRIGVQGWGTGECIMIYERKNILYYMKMTREPPSKYTHSCIKSCISGCSLEVIRWVPWWSFPFLVSLPQHSVWVFRNILFRSVPCWLFCSMF